eukprot:jgi/Ulvmu1/12669/UM094_0025.1
MASGLTGPLAVLTGLQVAVGLPLLLPVPSIRGPTISVYQTLSKGPGGYVGGTVLVTVTVLLASSIWEAISLDARENESSHQAMMTAVNLSRAHLAVVMCFVNISLAMAFWKLSLEMKSHGQLQKSHAALQKQAAGISQEYSRITSVSPPSKAAVAADPHDKAEIIAAKLELEKAVEARAKAEKEVEHIRMQLKSLEASYDALMAESMKQPVDRAGDIDGGSGIAEGSGDSLAFARRRKAD